MNRNTIKIYVLGLTSMLVLSCSKDFMNESPESYISKEQAGKSSAASQGTLRGIYANLRSYGIAGYGGHEDYGHKSMLSIADLMGNDVVMNYLNWNGFYYNFSGRVTTSSRTHLPWFTYYLQIKNANAIINSISATTADESLKYNRGQALALRAYFHFMLARFYGPTYIGNEDKACIPINTGESSKIRNTVKDVYAQIEKDLKGAVSNLDGYSRPNKEFLDKSVAQAFLADVYLEMGKYSEAAQLAHEARSSYTLLSEQEWKNGFYQIDQPETMWGADLNAELTSFVASFFSHFDNTNTGYAAGGSIAIDKRLYEAMSDTDYRKSMFAGPDDTDFPTLQGDGSYKSQTYPPYTSFKFRDLTSKRTEGDYIYLRSSLLYFIEAEGLARSGDESGARQVLYDIIHARDSSYNLSTKTGQDLLDEIILQKRIELWGEGFAFFDLKRLGKEVERSYSGSNHGDFGKIDFPAGDKNFTLQIPQRETDTNPGVLPNNP